MESKYDLISAKSPTKTNHSPFKTKPKAVTFPPKNGLSFPKKIKLEHNDEKGSNGTCNGGKNEISLQEQRRSLPIFNYRNKLLELIKRYQTLIIISETGSGKSTQIPQYINASRLQENGRIGITQPRRIAAISIALRVAKEMGNGLHVGESVGYTVRFEDVTNKRTKIKYLTDGMLLQESISDRLLLEYTVIILDEAHERTVHTDVLFGIVKEAQALRKQKGLPALKILLMSATMDVDHFSKYFNNCKVVYLEGRLYPVNLYYTKTKQDDYTTSCVATFFKIHREAPASHHVLIFLTGQEEIEAVAYQIRMLARDSSVQGPPIRVHPLYSQLSSTQQMAVFSPTRDGTRKVIISTNIAETSLTIGGIKYVIDSGMVKLRTFHPATGLDLLKVQKISQEQAWQRYGRAGRESEGHCYRIYTRNQFEAFGKSTVPEIQRSNLSIVAIQLLALGIHAAHFDFMDKPPREAVANAFEQLRFLGAVDKEDNLTVLGKRMVQFPLDPRFSKIILSAQTYSCLEEILIIVAILSSESIFFTPQTKREHALGMRQKFASAYGDHITLLNVFREFKKVAQNDKRAWCHENFINLRNIMYASDVRSQLLGVCKRCDIPISSCGSNMDQVRKCLLSGLFMNVAELHREKQYITLNKRQVTHIHPSSAIHGQKPGLVIFTEVVQTNKCYLKNITTIEKDWMQEVVPEYARNHQIRYNAE